MRKSLIIFILIGGVALGLGLFNTLVKSGEVKTIQTAATSITQTANPATQTLGLQSPVIDNPTTFSIAKLGIKSYVEHVGLDKKGAMDIPKDDKNVAWYNLGAKPGQKGNAVIAGHLDTKTGSPAVFWDLNKLKEGDEVSVSGEDGKELKFKVTKIATYKLEDFPLQEVFGQSDKVRLNMITCEGTFNKDSKLYSHRLVVYSEMI